MNLGARQLDGEQRVLFGVAFRGARLRAGYSQRGLGAIASLNQSTISRLEAGTLEGIRYSTLMRLFRALAVVGIHIETQPHGWYAELTARYSGDTHHPGTAFRGPPNAERGSASGEEVTQSPS